MKVLVQLQTAVHDGRFCLVGGVSPLGVGTRIRVCAGVQGVRNPVQSWNRYDGRIVDDHVIAL
jgi:hypothetical protein